MLEYKRGWAYSGAFCMHRVQGITPCDKNASRQPPGTAMPSKCRPRPPTVVTQIPRSLGRETQADHNPKTPTIRCPQPFRVSWRGSNSLGPLLVQGPFGLAGISLVPHRVPFDGMPRYWAQRAPSRKALSHSKVPNQSCWLEGAAVQPPPRQQQPGNTSVAVYLAIRGSQ